MLYYWKKIQYSHSKEQKTNTLILIAHALAVPKYIELDNNITKIF